VDEISTESAAPGGGSVAALCGALSTALASMVANLTVGRKGQEDVWEEMIDLADRAQAEKDAFLLAVDEDAQAFRRVLEAMRLASGTDEEAAKRKAALRDANRGAILVPLGVMERALGAIDLALMAATRGNPNSASDAGVAGLAARAAAEGAYYNVLINLKGLEDDAAWASQTRSKSEALVTKARIHSDTLAAAVMDRLSPR
jgi:glutamate formiminotransferase/formiminotetrahydrofolate cyclodeaminase